MGMQSLIPRISLLLALIAAAAQTGLPTEAASDFASTFKSPESVDGSTPGISPQSAPNISINAYPATDKVPRGHLLQVAVVMDIPSGYHVNSNRPLESFLKATQLKVEAPSGVRAGATAYPRAVLRKFSFSNDKLSVYEGRVILRFSVTVPASFKDGSLELKAKLNYQSCSDALCYPPQSRDVRVQVPVVGATEPVKRINAEYFGRGR